MKDVKVTLPYEMYEEIKAISEVTNKPIEHIVSETLRLYISRYKSLQESVERAVKNAQKLG